MLYYVREDIVENRDKRNVILWAEEEMLDLWSSRISLISLRKMQIFAIAKRLICIVNFGLINLSKEQVFKDLELKKLNFLKTLNQNFLTLKIQYYFLDKVWDAAFFFQSQIEPLFSIPQNITYLLQMWRRLAYLATSGKEEGISSDFIRWESKEGTTQKWLNWILFLIKIRCRKRKK